MNFETVRRTYLYSGRVQGVGFRHTTCMISRQHRVTGYVRNLPDGRVEIVAEGGPEDLAGFAAAIADELGGYIRSVSVNEGTATGEFHSFTVKY